MLRREIAAEVMEHYCEHNTHGYSQVNRAPDGTERITLSDGTHVTIAGGDTDCSELVRRCYEAAGVLGGYWQDYLWTGNEAGVLLSHGFVEVSVHNVQRGDVLWVKGHTAIYLGNGYIGEAHHGDYYGGLDGAAGDQDGTEVRMARYYPSHWTAAYHYDYSDEADELTDEDLAAIRAIVQSELANIGMRVWSYRNTTYEKVDAYRNLRDIRDELVADGSKDPTATTGKLRDILKAWGEEKWEHPKNV